MANGDSRDPKGVEDQPNGRATDKLSVVLQERSGAVFRGAPRVDQGGPPIELDLGPEALKDVLRDRLRSLTQVHATLARVGQEMKEFFPKVPETLPPRMFGLALNPDGTAATDLTVEALRPRLPREPGGESVAWPTPRSVTDRRGAFGIDLPIVPVPAEGLRLRFRGRNGTSDVVVARTELIGTGGKIGTVVLPTALRPLERSIISQLKDVIPTSAADVDENPEDFTSPTPTVTLGEGDCAQFFRGNEGVIDRFGYSILFRLIDPQLSQKELTLRLKDGRGSLLLPLLPRAGSLDAQRSILVRGLSLASTPALVDRIPIDQPIDVSQFHEEVATDPLGVPKAASLGLGYVVKMHQAWIPVGLSTGDLLYSLPLAPGEQQRIAVFEQNQTLAVSERETLSLDETQRFDEVADSSTLATFQSALEESASGGSTFETSGSSFGVGGALGIGGMVKSVLFGAGGAIGYGSSSGSGETTSFQNASRDFVSSATQDFHAQLSRRASASRRSNRTGIRLASASDREQVVTKVIANYNHCHALTILYREVLRHFNVNTKIDDVQLVSFIPLELIPFLPSGQPTTLPATGLNRAFLLTRYEMVLRYLEVLIARLRRRPDYVYGLELLRNFAADPGMTVQSASGSVQDVVTFKATGTFFAFEDVFVTLVTRTGGRVGPIKLVGGSMALSADPATPSQLLQMLRSLRQSQNGVERAAFLTLPNFVARSDVARFELTRRFHTFTHRLNASQLVGSAFLPIFNVDVTLSPTDLERELGGPLLLGGEAKIQPTGETYLDSISPQELTTTVLPLPVLRVPPVLSFADLLRIEAVFQHVVRHTVEFSRLVWASMTPEERIILFDRFTIGVPEGGLPDATQEVPLVNCVVNEVLGFFGNAMVLPFHIPPEVAQTMGVTSRDVQDALLKFHRQAFSPAKTSITLPTRGVLGEAVLGSCNACEKIDLTRFWNWKDSAPPLTVENIKDLATGLKGQGLVGDQGAQAPSQLAGAGGGAAGSLVTISTGDKAPAPSANLLEQLISQLPKPTEFKDLTGISALQELGKETIGKAAETQKETLSTASKLAEKALEGLPNVLKAKAGIDEESQKKKEEDQKKAKEQAAADTKTQEEAAKAASDARAAHIRTLTDNAARLIALAGARSDQASADSVAQQAVATATTSGALTILEQAALFDVFRIKNDDDDATKQGKTAFLKALGLGA